MEGDEEVVWLIGARSRPANTIDWPALAWAIRSKLEDVLAPSLPSQLCFGALWTHSCARLRVRVPVPGT